ncbi:hypothetical protein FRC03_003654 [Tulasnella sp. 419]|nr:hypothetical protein FRC03_003654 [Tulasnella sp. 419]
MYHPPPIGHRRFHFVRSALDYFFLSLLFWDFILALGAVMNIRWVYQAGITTGSFCTAQGVLKQIGAVGVAFSSTAIAIYTFLVIFARWQIPNTRWLPLTITGLITLFLILLPIIGSRINTDPPYYGPSTYWCWISPNYGSERVGLEYGLIWFISALSIALYVPLFFVLRGNLQVDYQQRVGSSGRKMKISWKSIRSGGGDSQQGDDKKESTTIAKQMLAYPIAYSKFLELYSISEDSNLS